MAPLIHSKSPKAFKKNIETEVAAGKPDKQAVAIVFSEKREAEKDHKSEGGMLEEMPDSSDQSDEDAALEAELHEHCASELMSGLESKNKQQILEAMRSLIAMRK